jgi:hypothetical protein
MFKEMNDIDINVKTSTDISPKDGSIFGTNSGSTVPKNKSGLGFVIALVNARRNA